MSVIVVISIFITLCTCTIIMWVRDVLRDYDLQRRRGVQRRRLLLQQQRQAAQQPARVSRLSFKLDYFSGEGEVTVLYTHKNGKVVFENECPCHTHPPLQLAAVPVGAPPPSDGQTTPSSEASADTLTAVEDLEHPGQYHAILYSHV